LQIIIENVGIDEKLKNGNFIHFTTILDNLSLY